MEKARSIIIDLYVRCEDDFIKGLEIFEAIVSKQIMETSKQQISALENAIQTTIADPPSKSDPTDDDDNETDSTENANDTENESKTKTPDLSDSAKDVVEDVIDAAADEISEPTTSETKNNSSSENTSSENTSSDNTTSDNTSPDITSQPSTSSENVSSENNSDKSQIPSQTAQSANEISQKATVPLDTQNQLISQQPPVQTQPIQNTVPTTDSGGFIPYLGNSTIDPLSFI